MARRSSFSLPNPMSKLAEFEVQGLHLVVLGGLADAVELDPQVLVRRAEQRLGRDGALVQVAGQLDVGDAGDLDVRSSAFFGSAGFFSRVGGRLAADERVLLRLVGRGGGGTARATATATRPGSASGSSAVSCGSVGYGHGGIIPAPEGRIRGETWGDSRAAGNCPLPDLPGYGIPPPPRGTRCKGRGHERTTGDRTGHHTSSSPSPLGEKAGGEASTHPGCRSGSDRLVWPAPHPAFGRPLPQGEKVRRTGSPRS